MIETSLPLPAGDEVPDHVVLRDGSVARLRFAREDDRELLADFFHSLSAEALQRRFFASVQPPPKMLDAFCTTYDPGSTSTLLALRQVDGGLHVIACASYFKIDAQKAEVAFAVDDRFQHRGLGTALLERLATLAVQHGFTLFEAVTLADNTAMLDVFRESGFEIQSKTDHGAITVQLSLEVTYRATAAAERRDSLATVASLRSLLEPESVAVVGASRDLRSIGRRVLKALSASGFRGPIYPVNPHATELDGLRCYASLTEIPRGTDLAILTVPRAIVLDVVAQCAAAGVKSLVVITAGFAESGPEGRALQQRLLDTVRGYGMRMVGPNCMGLVNANTDVRLNASFSAIMPAAGPVAFSSQSGALGLAILELATERGIGLSTFVSVGNKADVSGNDLLQYWEADPHTSVVLLYLESFGNPRRFARLARRIGRKKPIVVVKSGRTPAGSRAAGSHTAALAASDTAADALFQQTGVIRADTIDEMFDIAACLDTQPLPAGRRVAIVTNAGGPGILAVDACEANGLIVGSFGTATRARLAEFLPAEASIGNPVDMVASAGPAEYRRAIEVALTSDDVDALIVIYTPVDPASSGDTLQAIRNGIAAGRAAGATQKPILACLMAGGGRPQALIVGAERVPAFAFPENAARALSRVAKYADWRREAPGLLWRFEDVHADTARSICQNTATNSGGRWLSPEQTRQVLGAFGLPMATGVIAHSADEAATCAAALGFPVVAKLVAGRVQHKTDVGGVRLNLIDESQVRQAFAEIHAAGCRATTPDDINGVLIQTMINGGVETMIGVSDDPSFGPLVAFGLGGIFVEVLADVNFRIAPLTDRDADELLHGIRGLPLLKGYRGHPPADLDALRELLLRVSRLAVEVPEIAELDLNPVIALPPGQGCRIVDARIRVRG
ncbi:MAG TPA: GNAT family N-acetyltransferase [Vicinamibacterales bacterium]